MQAPYPHVILTNQIFGSTQSVLVNQLRLVNWTLFARQYNQISNCKDTFELV